jgi:hypothetical protein
VSGDQVRVVALWTACELTRPWNDPAADIARKVALWGTAAQSLGARCGDLASAVAIFFVHLVEVVEEDVDVTAGREHVQGKRPVKRVRSAR